MLSCQRKRKYSLDEVIDVIEGRCMAVLDTHPLSLDDPDTMGPHEAYTVGQSRGRRDVALTVLGIIGRHKRNEWV